MAMDSGNSENPNTPRGKTSRLVVDDAPEKWRWVIAAQKVGLKLPAWAVRTLNEAADKLGIPTGRTPRDKK